MKKETAEKDSHFIGLLEFIAERMNTIADNTANIASNLARIADGEQRLIKLAVDKEVENKGYGTAKENEDEIINK